MKYIYCILFALLTSTVSAQFVENSQNFGIGHSHVSEVLMGGGVTFLDFNNDGLLDYYLTSGENLGDKLYLNIGHDRYLDYSVQSKVEFITSRFYTFGAITLDFNNDGYDDIFLTTWDKSQRNVLLRNDGNMQFTEVGAIAGINDAAASTSATALDVNNDGLLDIYVVNYIDTPGAIFDGDGEVIGFDHICASNFLYINNGDDSFTELAATYGVDDIGCGLAVMSTDYNQDGLVDLLVANDFGEWVGANKLYKNVGGDFFEDVSSISGMDLEIYGMGIAQGDIDKDGDIDYYITNIGHNSLMINDGSGNFVDKSIELGVDNTISSEGTNTTGWGTFLVDFDNNSELDLYVANGYIPAAPFLNNSLIDENRLFMSYGAEFTEVSEAYNLDNSKIHRGTAFADLNNDGRIDFITISCAKIDSETNNATKSLIYYNRISSKNWFQVDLEGTTSNRDAFGAKVKLYANNQIYYKEKYSGGSHASQNTSILHFGLGDIDQIDSLLVVWPSGLKTVHENIIVNKRYYLKENESAKIFDCNAVDSLVCYEHYIEGCTDSESTEYDFYAFTNNDEICGRQETVTSILDWNNITFGPNPVDTYLTIRNSSNLKNVSVTNLAGKKLLSQNILSNSDLVKLDFSDLNIGVYIITFVDNVGNENSTRIIKN